PWRWVAGPEWALGSALAIVALSLLGAPAVRQGVKPISGFARVIGPRPNRNAQNAPLTAGGQNQLQSRTQIARGPVRLRNTPAFDIVGAQGFYFRTDSFDAYERRGWSKRWDWTNSEGRKVDPPSQRSRARRYIIPGAQPYTVSSLSANPGRAPGKSDSARIGLLLKITARNETVAIPTPGEYLKTGESVATPTVDTNTGTATLRTASAYEELPIYYSPYLGADPNAKSGRGVAESNGEPIRDPALVTSSASARVLAFAREVAGSGPDGMRAERLRAAIAARVAYNINASAAEDGIDSVDRALFDTKEGYCDVFASAMVLGARAIGIPARYTIGYLGDPRLTSPDGNLTLLDSDAHAWAELYFEGRGWVPYDATAGARVVPNGGRRDGDDTIPWYRRPWVTTAANVAIGIMVLAGAVLLLWPRRRDARASMRARDEVVDRFIRTLARPTRRDRRLDESLIGYVGVLGERLGAARPSAERLARDLERTLYGPDEPNPDSNRELARRVQSLRRELKAVPKSR
ncbi:transglutaminase domain-containing protein, partial [bacterium]